jgi:hypothetical protein
LGGLRKTHINKMEYPNVAVSAKEEPEFQTLLNSLRGEVSTSLELSNRVRYLSNNLQRMSEVPYDNDMKEREPIGVIEMLWAEVWRIREANSELQRTVDHLQRVIGS